MFTLVALFALSLLLSSYAYSLMPSSSRMIRQQQYRVESKLYSEIVAEGSGSPCRIKVVGVGGGGGNAVNRMVEVSEGKEKESYHRILCFLLLPFARIII